MPITCAFAKDVTHVKQDPQPYALAAERLGVHPQDCIALEDSTAGIMSAAAGVHVIVVGKLTDFDDQLPRIENFHGIALHDLIRLADLTAT